MGKMTEDARRAKSVVDDLVGHPGAEQVKKLMKRLCVSLPPSPALTEALGALRDVYVIIQTAPTFPNAPAGDPNEGFPTEGGPL